MTHEQLQNLFRIDRQQSTHDTNGEQGTGLGLIVCKEFLEKHDSRLHVESREGVGSRFWFEVVV
ncbi:MAG: ATP-binding protein [Bacteroidales bacterium]|nr:ATP-binding protein [Bacteroidales bacterium]